MCCDKDNIPAIDEFSYWSWKLHIVQGFYHQKKQPGFDDRHNTNNQGEHKEISVIVFIEFR